MSPKHHVVTLSEASIRKLAHEIWEAEGRPEDRQLRHWYRAEQMLRESSEPQHEENHDDRRPTVTEN